MMREVNQRPATIQVLLTIVISCLGSSVAPAAECYVSCSKDRRIEAFEVDDGGSLRALGSFDLDCRPGCSCFDISGQHLYVGGSDPAVIQVMRRDGVRLRSVQTVTVPEKPSFLAITPSGQFLIASYYASGYVTVHRIVGEGRLSEQPIQTLDVIPRAHCVAIDPTGRFVFVPHTKASCITQFRIDATSGQLDPNEPPVLQREPDVSPRHLWFHPDGSVAFGSNESGRSISVYALDAETGTLQVTQTLPSMPASFPGKATTSRVEAHPSGKFAYIANRGHGTIATFAFDETSQTLNFLNHTPCEKTTRGFAISPDGKALVAAGQNSNRLVCFGIAEDGTLTRRSSVACGETPWWVTFRPTIDPTEIESGQPGVQVTKANRSTELALGQGMMAGEPTSDSILLQTRLTAGTQLDEQGDLPGHRGIARFEWSTDATFVDAETSTWSRADAASDFIVRHCLTGIHAATRYYYRVHFAINDESPIEFGPIGSFRTLGGRDSIEPTTFLVGSCMNYIKFMHGRAGNAGGPITATAEDKRLGFPAFATMNKIRPDFFVGTGDIVYYDNPFRVARTVTELRNCWHEQFRFPRMIEFFRDVPCYWSKDDHDFRFNDSDNEGDRIPLPQTGINLFREQLPIAPAGDVMTPNYRTHRVNRHLQIWLTEGRDHRSANDAEDGPNKSMWGPVQKQWLKQTLAKSDATWKIIVSPTPMVGPDDAYKNDNHANLQGFRHEANEFFAWVRARQLQDSLVLICGDRHWQYHSVHPSGVNEFAVGALNDENSRMGVAPGDEFGSDPDGSVKQLYTSRTPSGGFLRVKAGDSLVITHFNDDGDELNQTKIP